MSLLTKLLPNKLKNKELKPTTPKPRHDCPFYGFHLARGMFIDSKGNQCAVIINSYSPCQMGMAGQTPNWSECGFNTEESRRSMAKYANELVVFPDEFYPKGAKSWRGISLKEWLEYVRNPETPRP